MSRELVPIYSVGDFIRPIKRPNSKHYIEILAIDYEKQEYKYLLYTPNETAESYSTWRSLERISTIQTKLERALL